MRNSLPGNSPATRPAGFLCLMITADSPANIVYLSPSPATKRATRTSANVRLPRFRPSLSKASTRTSSAPNAPPLLMKSMSLCVAGSAVTPGLTSKIGFVALSCRCRSLMPLPMPRDLQDPKSEDAPLGQTSLKR